VQVRKLYLKSLLTLACAAAVGGILLGCEPNSGPSPVNSDPDPRVSIIPRPRAETKSTGNIRVDVNEVTIPVTVTDILGKPVLGLPSETFHIFENGEEQPIARLSQEDTPLSIGLLFDASASMLGKLERSREAISQLLRSSMQGDEYFLVEFNDSPKRLYNFTPNASEIEEAMQAIQPRGWTALLDALYLSVNQMKHAKNARRALVILSDGADNNSRFSEGELRSLLRESDVSLYAIGMTGPIAALSNMNLLSKLAGETGGRLFPCGNISQLPDAMAKLSAALREQYQLVYTPKNPAKDGKYRRVQLKITPPPGFPRLHAFWRNGYYTP
jgi:Ca-activated chloride channel homolog